MPRPRRFRAAPAVWLAVAVALGSGAAAGCRTQAAAVVAAPLPSPAAPTAASTSAAPRPAARAPIPSPAPSSLPAAAPPRPAPDDPITDLIRSLERQYADANTLYQQGRLDEARQGFDATVDRLLASNYPIRDTPRLQAELDSLLDRIHALESDVMQSGGLSDAKPQATPLDRVPELTFPLDAATRAQIERETRAALATNADGQLPLVVNDVVMRYIHYFTTQGREGFMDGLRRAGRYRAMVESTFRAVGVPTDLIYLAQLESDFDPTLVSRAGARGMWQFMAVRSDDYGLKRTHWVDERDDPQKATLAAAQHLKDLHAEFGDWYLAMAAYNAGPATIQAIVARTGYADYWKLYQMGALPKYLRNYVPVILATALIASNPALYGIPAIEPDSPYLVDTETLTAALDLRLAAECAQVTVADLQHLNPSLLHFLAPEGFELKVPQGTGRRFEEALARVPSAHRTSWRLHWVAAGDTWTRLANRYHLSAARLRAANPTLAGPEGEPAVGTPLALPMAGGELPPVPRKRTSSKPPRGAAMAQPLAQKNR